LIFNQRFKHSRGIFAVPLPHLRHRRCETLEFTQ
jgi:hypothetical protein